jgi:preprotein translocase subunit SecA
MIYDTIESIVYDAQDNRDFEGFNMEMITNLGIESPITEQDFMQMKPDEIVQRVYEVAYDSYRKKSERIARETLPVIKDVFETQGQQYKNIAIPMTDGVKSMDIVTNLERAYNSEGREVIVATEKMVTLKIIDDAWKEHLRELDDLKQSVQNASYEQKDPLLIYKFESFELFKQMINKINRDIVSFITKCDLPANKQVQVESVFKPANFDMSKLKTGRTEIGGGDAGKFGHDTQQKQVTQPVRVEKKVGRNDPCPCGSGKKYKHCHGR